MIAQLGLTARSLRQHNCVLASPTFSVASAELQRVISWVNYRASVNLASLSLHAESAYMQLLRAARAGSSDSSDRNTFLRDALLVEPHSSVRGPRANYSVDRLAVARGARAASPTSAASLLALAWYRAPGGALHLRVCGRRMQPHRRASDGQVLGLALPGWQNLHPFYAVYADTLHCLYEAVERAGAGTAHCAGQLQVLAEEDPLDEAAWATALDRTLDLDVGPDVESAAARLRSWRRQVCRLHAVTAADRDYNTWCLIHPG